MIAPGDTLLNIDEWNHLYFVLAVDPAANKAALANFTSHWPESPAHRNCTIVYPGEHPWLRRESCVYFHGAMITPLDELQRRADSGRYPHREPLPSSLLHHIQHSALNHPLTPHEVKAALRP